MACALKSALLVSRAHKNLSQACATSRQLRLRSPETLVFRKILVHAAQDREAVLQQIQSMQDSELRSWYAENKDMVSLDFMLWMTNREAGATGTEKESLDALGSKLTAFREGLDPESAAEMSSILSALGLPPASNATAIEAEIQQRRGQLALKLAKTATSPQELVAQQSRAQQFTKDLWERKIVSTTEIIGRAPVEAEQSLRGLDAATAADRILAVLLQIPDEQERIGMVAEAFIPPATETIDELPEEELVHTSPMRLLQAVKLAIRRIETDSTPNDEQYILPGTPGMSPAELQEALRGIQAAIFAAWDPPSF